MFSKIKLSARLWSVLFILPILISSRTLFAVDISPNPLSTAITGSYSLPSGTTVYITSSGSITSTNQQTVTNNLSGANAPSINNAGNITSVNIAAGTQAFANSGTVVNFINSGTISAPSYYVISNSGTISNLVNSGTISGGNPLDNMSGTITVLTNTGTISPGIWNCFMMCFGSGGSIGTLNNSQGAGNVAGSLSLTGRLPTNYNVIINSPTNFGRLAVSSGTGTTTFGIYSGSTINNGTYSSVLSGVSLSNLTATSGTYGSASWLLSNTSGSTWDLIISGYVQAVLGPSAADTQISLQNTASALQSTYAMQNSVVANSLNYDCQVFDKNNVCVSAGGRNTNVQAGGVNNVSALLIAAYRALPEVRVGGYLDQNLSVTAAGSPINLGVNGPLVGLFAVWNENQDGTGTEVKVSGAYGQKNTTITRAVVGTSEAGVGSSSLTNTGVQAIAKYGFAIDKDIMVSPYIGIRYSQGNMGGYTEASSPTVTAPLTYSALNTNATTLMAGVHGKYRVAPEATIQASVGVETDTTMNNGTLTATGVAGLTAVNFNPNPVQTRPVAMLGAYYDVAKAQRVALTGVYRQEPFQAVGSTTVLATYTIGF